MDFRTTSFHVLVGLAVGWSWRNWTVFFPKFDWFTRADNLASLPKQSLPTVSGYMLTAASMDTFRSKGSRQSFVPNLTQWTKAIGVVGAELGEKDVPLAVLSRKLKRKESKKINQSKLSSEGHSNPIPASNQDETGRVFTEELLQRVSWAKCWLLELKIR